MIKYFSDTLTSAFSGDSAAQASLQIGLVFIIFFALIGFWIFKANVIDRFKLPLGKTHKTALLQHDFFISYNRLRSAIQTFSLHNEQLTSIFKIIVSNKLKTAHQQTQHFIESQNWTKITVRELESKVFSLLKEIVDAYNYEILQTLQEKYGIQKGKAIYDYVMNASGIGFNHWHATNIRHIEKMIASIIGAKVIKGTSHKMQLILYELLFGLHSGVIDAEKAFYGFNGKLASILAQPNE
jgi:hypothetical protein